MSSPNALRRSNTVKPPWSDLSLQSRPWSHFGRYSRLGKWPAHPRFSPFTPRPLPPIVRDSIKRNGSSFARTIRGRGGQNGCSRPNRKDISVFHGRRNPGLRWLLDGDRAAPSLIVQRAPFGTAGAQETCGRPGKSLRGKSNRRSAARNKNRISASCPQGRLFNSPAPRTTTTMSSHRGVRHL